MRIAVINQKTGGVVNVIEASMEGIAPRGCFLIEAPPHVDVRWKLTPDGYTSDDKAVLAAYEESLAIEAENRRREEEMKAEPEPEPDR